MSLLDSKFSCGSIDTSSPMLVKRIMTIGVIVLMENGWRRRKEMNEKTCWKCVLRCLKGNACLAAY